MGIQGDAASTVCYSNELMVIDGVDDGLEEDPLDAGEMEVCQVVEVPDATSVEARPELLPFVIEELPEYVEIGECGIEAITKVGGEALPGDRRFGIGAR